MGNDNYGNAGLLAASFAVAVLIYMMACSTAHALEVEVRFQNPSPTLAYDGIEVCRAEGCDSYAVACAPGATCELVADLPVGTWATWLLARSGALVSVASNTRTLTVIEPPPPVDDCARADFDGSGTITTADFARFFAVYGQTCQP